MDMPIIPFRKVGLSILPEIERRIQRCSDKVNYVWANEYQRAYKEVRNYVDDGIIPPNGFCVALGGFTDAFKRPVLEAYNFQFPMPTGSLEAFYAICTSSAHTIEIRSKVDYNDPIQFDRALSEPLAYNTEYYEQYLKGRFLTYKVERAQRLNPPFDIENKLSHFGFGTINSLTISVESSFESSIDKLRSSVLDLYKKVPAPEVPNHCNEQVIRLDVFTLDNHLRIDDYPIPQHIQKSQKYVHTCIHSVLNSLHGVTLSDDRKLNVKQVLRGSYNNEWYIPNYRVTITDDKESVECYLIMRFIPLPSFADMISFRATSLCRSLENIAPHPGYVPNQLIRYFLCDLNTLLHYRSELRKTAPFIELRKYDPFIHRGRIPGRLEYNVQMNWDVIPKYVFHAAYTLLETYNHHLALDATPLVLPDSAISDDQRLDALQTHIKHRLASFGKDPSNYLTESSAFKGEVALTKKLVTYLESPNDYSVHGEAHESTGRLDIKIEFKYCDTDPLMIEAKIVKATEDKKMPSPSKVFKSFTDAVKQIREYTNHTDAHGMLLFFTLDLHEAQVTNVIDEELQSKLEIDPDAFDFDFLKIRNPINKITHIVKIKTKTGDGAIYYVRFMKLKSKAPSVG